MVRFIVWGTGGRGKNAAEIFGTDRIEAFIDSNPEKIGKQFYGRPIIQFADYKSNYMQYPILVSIVVEEAITDFLEEEHLFYFSYNECPPELIGYGWKRAKKYINDFRIREKKIAIYGHTLYSVLVYEYLKENGYECMGLIHNSKLSEKQKKYFHSFFPFIEETELSDISQNTTVLQTVSDYECKEDSWSRKVKNIYDWKDIIPEYYNHKIAYLNGKYKGKRCFIVATGPSLTFEDLETLKRNHEFCISLNTIFCSFDKTDWRPDQYVVVDVDAIEKYDKDIRKMDVKEKFIADASLDFDYDSLSDEFLIYHSIFTKSVLKHGAVSDDFAKYAYNTGTITAVCLQLAMYEGFGEIYLLGCDCSYLYTGLKHFNEPEEMQINGYGVADTAVPMLQNHMNAYQKIKEYAEDREIKIYNATRGGYLEVFERVDFDMLFDDSLF